MHAVSVANAMKDLPNIIDYTINNVEEVIIVSDHGSVVVIDQDEWDNIQETLRLLKDKKSLKALLESHRVRDAKKEIHAKSIEEAFSDLQS